MMDLSRHGAACRCLLRLRENEGLPGISDRTFITTHLSRFPSWKEHPGGVDADGLFELAREMRLAAGIEIFRDYDRVLQEHRAGRSILVCTERTPEQVDPEPSPGRFALLVVAMNETSFTLWCPFSNGKADDLPEAGRAWWDRWLAIGIILHRPLARSNPSTDAAPLNQSGPSASAQPEELL